MAESTKKVFLDLAGLKRYDEKIKSKMAADDATTLSSAKKYTDDKIGTLDTGISTVAAGILAEKNRATGVEGTLTNLTTDAKDTLVAAINEVDAHTDANTSAIGVASKAAVGTEGSEGYQPAVVATGLTGRIESLEAAVGAGGSVDSQIDAKINALDVSSNASEAVAGVTVTVDEVDGKVQKPVVAVADNTVSYTAKTADAAAALAAANETGVIKGQAIVAIKSYVDAKASEAQTAAIASAQAKDEALDADFTEDKAVSSTSGHVTVGVKEEDGKITSVTVADSDIASASSLADLQAVVGISKLGTGESTIDARLDVLEGTGDGSVAKALADAKTYADGKDTAMDARVDALEATHATKTVGEGDAAHTVFQTVAEEAASAVAKVVDSAPEAFDTLKEIADWIDKSANGNEADGFDAATRITNLETAVGASSLVVADGKTQTVANAISKAVADEASRIDGVVGTPDSGKTIQGEIDDVEASIATLNGTDATTGSVANSIKVAIEALDAEKTQAASATQALSLSITEVDGKITAISGDIETISNDDIDALFTTAE